MVAVSLSNVVVIPLVGKLSEAIAAKSLNIINLVVFATLGVFFLKGLFMYGQVYFSAFVGQGVVRDLRIELYKKIQDLSLDFFAKWRTGEIISRTLSDIGVMQSATVASATEIFPNLLTLVSVISYLFYLNWRLTLLSIVILPLLLLVMTKFGKEMRYVSKKAQMKAADIASILQETISGISVVKSFTMEKHEVKRFSDESDRSFWIALRAAAVHATQTPLLSFMQTLAIVAVVWYGSFEVISGRLAPSNLIAFFTGIALLADPIAKLSKMNMVIQKSLASAERIFEMLDISKTIKESPNAIKLDKVDGAIEFKNISFQYDPKEAPALEDINISVKPGEIIALVGPSGAGKTTFVNLIPRFYDPERGSILVDGKDIKGCQLYSLRKQMGIVPQETLLFSGSLRDNIAYGKIDATDDEVINAAKMANAHEFIKDLSDGYNTSVGERGVRLSGGQRQRIAIARAILRDPRILILDEATSSLDTESERLVQDALEKLMKGRTTFVIAHRLSTVQIADRILVLKDGRIEEEGSHKQLIEKDGLYKKLYEMQFRDEKKGKSNGS
jgi:subfamily B ATP-binding cassette protein MsbA